MIKEEINDTIREDYLERTKCSVCFVKHLEKWAMYFINNGEIKRAMNESRRNTIDEGILNEN